MLLSPELLLLLAAVFRLALTDQTPVHVVSGTLGRPANFSLNIHIPFGETVERIEWIFQSETGPARIFAEFINGEMKKPYPEDRFGQRLQRINETTLTIKELEVEDGGLYTAHVRFRSGILEHQTFSLQVFDPVPQPQIHLEQLSRSRQGCNVTLQCLASGKGRFNFSWKTGDPLQDIETESDWHQLSPNGSAISLFWQPGSLDNTVTCLISNPADQKSTSCDIRSICDNASGERSASPVACLVLPVLLILVAILGYVIWRRRRKRLLSTGVPSSSLPNPECAVLPDSAKTPRRSPLEGDDEQEHEQFSEQDTSEKSITVYAKLQRPTHSFDQVTS